MAVSSLHAACAGAGDCHVSERYEELAFGASGAYQLEQNNIRTRLEKLQSYFRAMRAITEQLSNRVIPPGTDNE